MCVSKQLTFENVTAVSKLQQTRKLFQPVNHYTRALINLKKIG